VSLFGGDATPLRFAAQRKEHITAVSSRPTTIEDQLVCAD
jgi:hypothetical protein